MRRNDKKSSLHFGFDLGFLIFHDEDQTGEKKAACVLGGIFLADLARVGRICQLGHRTHLGNWLGHTNTARWRVNSDKQTNRNQYGNHSAEEMGTHGEILVDRKPKLKI